MAFQNTSFTDIDNLNLGIPINQNGEPEKVLSIVINGVSRNTLGLRDIIKGAK